MGSAVRINLTVNGPRGLTVTRDRARVLDDQGRDPDGKFASGGGGGSGSSKSSARSSRHQTALKESEHRGSASSRAGYHQVKAEEMKHKLFKMTARKEGTPEQHRELKQQIQAHTEARRSLEDTYKKSKRKNKGYE